MCGIVGLTAGVVDRERLARASDCQAHRGPDDAGVYFGDGVGLAARRLSIIDLAGGHQPLSNERGDIWITFNGEVMNAPELRATLQASGHYFRTLSDTEVIVHAYEEWGDDCVTRLRGMFAFGIWDEPRRRLLLARDRFGIKPLHYATCGSTFAFSSEIRPLFKLLPALTPAAEPAALHELFRQGWLPTPLTMFAGIKQLPAGHTLVVARGALTVRPYWRPLFPQDAERGPAQNSRGREELVWQFMNRLRDAVSSWRMSDVPVGSLLSGGVDSGALAALLTELAGPIDTFHIAFAAATHDESEYAAQTAQAIGSRHHTLTFSDQDFDHLPEVVRRLESPQCSATSIPLFLLYRACRDAGFKVILTGEGADELLGGYHWYDGDRRVRPLLRIPRPFRLAAARLPLPISAAGKRVLQDGTIDAVDRFALWHEVGRTDVLAALLGKAAVGNISGTNGRSTGRAQPPWVPDFLAQAHPLHQFMTQEAQTRLPDFINLEVDRMSMSHSVEARPPFLDHHLWEFCAQLPVDAKLNKEMNKWVLRMGIRELLPDVLAFRRKKGLASPHVAWWRQVTLPAWAEDAMHPASLEETGYFQWQTVARLRSEHERGRADHSRLLMGVLTTQIWHDQFVVGS